MRNDNRLTEGIIILALGLSLGLVAGCGDTGSGLDNNDAGINTNDASSNPVDSDGDGYAASEDCDDSDPAVYPGVSRGCQSDCDIGVQICLADGTWLDCSARTDCDCTTPGETRIVDCGNCGEAAQECGLDLLWGYPSDCLNEGVCAAGDTETGACELCGSRSRICGNECTWGTWDESDCSGVCTPGEQTYEPSVTNPWLTVISECSSSCEFEVVDAGYADCLLAPRAGNQDFKDDICISAGPFIMGSACAEYGTPVHTVNLSAYFIDMYPVTVSRYEECVLAGACTEPENDWYSTYHNSDLAKPVNWVSWYQAQDFCQWDGGRRLPTEAEWEKAARGPEPRNVQWPWGNILPTCNYKPMSGCGYPDYWPVDVTECSGGASFYGVMQIGTNVYERTSDWFDSGYYSSSPTVDPQGPAAGTYKTLRGTPWGESDDCLVSSRTPGSLLLGGYKAGFRCARDAL